MFCKAFGVHTVNGISLIINRRHTGIRFGDDRNGYVLFDIADNGYQLVRSYRTVDPNCHSTCTLKGDRSLHSISSAENASVSFYGHCTHYRKRTYGCSSIQCSKCFLDIDHGFRSDQINTCIFKNLNLFTVCFVCHFIGEITGRLHHLACCGNITGNIDLMSYCLSGNIYKCMVHFRKLILQSVKSETVTVSAESRCVYDLASCFNISLLQILQNFFVLHDPCFCTDSSWHSGGHKIGTGCSVKQYNILCQLLKFFFSHGKFLLCFSMKVLSGCHESVMSAWVNSWIPDRMTFIYCDIIAQLSG